MMTLANYAIGSSKHKDPNSAKALNKSLQIRNRAETSLKHCLKTHFRIPEDKRIEILNGIKEYYSRVPFNVLIWNKYQTGQCIVDSILLLDSKFNPYKALESLKMVERMLVNLVHQPWHQEFRKIFTYSGMFRLVVSDPLIGVEEIFKAAGFEQESREAPMHLILPPNKMPQTDDGESVTSVIFDCLIAQVVLNNIIEIFENCCKASRQPGEHLKGEVNCFSWIQNYFRERTHYTNERACSNIQHQLNDITDHLSRLEFSAIKSGPKQANGQLSGSQSSEILNHKSSSFSTGEHKNSGSSPTLTAQERTRKFLAQQPIDDENLLKLTDDILKVPNYDTNKEVVQKQLPDYDGSGPSKLPNRPADHGASSSSADLARHNGYLSNAHYQYQSRDGQPGASDRSASKLSDSYNKIDNQVGLNSLGSQRSITDSDMLASSMRADPPHNDRELLIPRQDRRYVTNQLQYRQQMASNMKSRANSSYDQHEFDGHTQVHHNAGLNYHGGPQNRHHLYDRPSCYEESSSSRHHNDQYQGVQPSMGGRGSNSRYGSSSNAKYESRNNQTNNHGNLMTHGRSYWSCGSCTFNNLADSEICEMCRNRKSSR